MGRARHPALALLEFCSNTRQRCALRTRCDQGPDTREYWSQSDRQPDDIFDTRILITQAVSGLFVDDDVFYAGPYAHVVSSNTGKFFEGLHHEVVNWIVVASIIHIAAALYHTFKMKQPIIRAMISGKKDADVVPVDEAIPHSAIIRAVIIALVTAGFVYWLVAIAPPPLLISF